MNRPIKTTSRPQLALQSYLDGLLQEATEELPAQPSAAEALPEPVEAEAVLDEFQAAVLEARVPALLGRLAERYDPELIVIACNTASTIALAHVRAALQAGDDCRPEGAMVAENALRGAWRLRCARGDLRVSITLAPTEPARVQHLQVSPLGREASIVAAAPACR